MHFTFGIIPFVCLYSSLFSLTCSPSIVISEEGENGMAPSVAINAQGEAAVVFVSQRKLDLGISAVYKDAQGSYSSPTSLLAKGNCYAPYCFIGSNGSVHALWEQCSQKGLHYAEKLPGQDWTAPLTWDGHQSILDPLLDENDRLLFLENVERGSLFDWSPTALQVCVKYPESSFLKALIPKVPVWGTDSSDVRGRALARNQAGDLFVMWHRGIAQPLIEGAWLLPNGSFSKAERCARLEHIETLFYVDGMVIDESKNITLVADRLEKGTQVLSRIDGKWLGWDSLMTKEEKSQLISDPQLAIDGAGNVLAVWMRKVEEIVYLEGSYKGFKKRWTRVAPVPLEGNPGKGLLRSDNKDGFVFVWEAQQDRSICGIYGVEFLSEEKAWSSPLQLSPEGSFCSQPSLVFSITGQGLLAWTRSSSTFDSCIEVTEIALK